MFLCGFKFNPIWQGVENIQLGGVFVRQHPHMGAAF